MLQIDYRNSEPLYIQIKENIKKLILTNALTEDEILPSVRILASNLAINVNTVQRAYKELEQEGYIYSVQGKGNFVSTVTSDIENKNREEIKHKIRELFREAYELGVNKEEIMEIVRTELKEE